LNMIMQPPLSTPDEPGLAPGRQPSAVRSVRFKRRIATKDHGEALVRDQSDRVARGADYVTIPVAAAMTGYSAKAIRRKIESGVWLEGREFRRAPDGHVLISVKGYESWVERGRA
jgi:hypothetical protein